MPLETEIKYLDANLDAVAAALRAAGARRLARRRERNEVYDDPGRGLRARGILIRLRADGRNLLTVKLPPEAPAPAGVKALREHETEVADLGPLRVALAALGLEVACVYEKLREEWALGDCHVCLDRLPFGDFVEVEGPPEALAGVAAALGLARLPASSASYHELNRAHRAARSLPAEAGFTFAPGAAPEFPGGSDPSDPSGASGTPGA
jgi:adenylate cyclase class 2